MMMLLISANVLKIIAAMKGPIVCYILLNVSTNYLLVSSLTRRDLTLSPALFWSHNNKFHGVFVSFSFVKYLNLRKVTYNILTLKYKSWFDIIFSYIFSFIIEVE